MKHHVLTLFLVFGFSIAFAQNWQNDFDKAKEIAKEKNRPIILVFQGSDWCAPCMKLELEIWSTEEFKLYAATHFVMLKADFPRKKKNSLLSEQQIKNNKLAEIYNPNGFFPHVVVLNSAGKVLGATGYKKIQPMEYINLLESFIL
ncbi:MAG: thioredoxin family protein [Bacteroidetes bacterium]|nr:thioredoxin family protein [Bacteroidota bacterium]